MKSKLMITALSMFFPPACFAAASVCLLTNTSGVGSNLSCDGADRTSTLANATSNSYSDISHQLKFLVKDGYRIAAQSSFEKNDGVSKSMWTLVRDR